jgi:CTP synthase
LPSEMHPFFVGTQAHPELTSRPLRPSPLFMGLCKAAMKFAEGGAGAGRAAEERLVHG